MNSNKSSTDHEEKVVNAYFDPNLPVDLKYLNSCVDALCGLNDKKLPSGFSEKQLTDLHDLEKEGNKTSPT